MTGVTAPVYVLTGRRLPPPGRRELYAAYQAKRDAAVHWRLDHFDHPDRARMWRAYRTGALWQRDPQQPDPYRTAIRAALTAAEHDIPYP